MGREEALLFAREGAKVVATDINEAAVQAVVKEIEAEGGIATAIAHNVASEEQWVSVVAATIEAYGKVDILVNNAGISFAVGMLDTTVEQWDKVMNINLSSVFLGMKHVVPHMQQNNGGSIVNISSIAGMAANYGFPSLAYVASKFAVRGMTKATAMEYGRYNIRVNSVHPGFIQTPMMVEATDEVGGEALAQIPLGRIADPVEVSNLVLFLASDESSYITASEHLVDAGMLAH